jgi:hypothetical protein
LVGVPTDTQTRKNVQVTEQDPIPIIMQLMIIEREKTGKRTIINNIKLSLLTYLLTYSMQQSPS